jgi:hypothetical protein
LTISKNWYKGISQDAEVSMKIPEHKMDLKIPDLKQTELGRKILSSSTPQTEYEPVPIGTDGWLSEEAKLSMDVIFYKN